MPKYTKRADGRLQATMTIDGKRVHFYGRTDREVQQKMIDFQKKKDFGPLFEEVAEEWWVKKEPKLAKNSLRNYVPAVRRAIEEYRGIHIREIESADVDEFIARFGETHAAKTTATQLNVLNQIMKYARMKRYTESVPTDIVEVPRGLRRTKRLLPPESDVEKANRISITRSWGCLRMSCCTAVSAEGKRLPCSIRILTGTPNRSPSINPCAHTETTRL